MKYYATLSIPICLIRGEVFVKVGDRVALGLHICRRPRHTACRCRVNTGRVIHIIRSESGIHDLFAAEIASELVNDGSDHLQMP